MRLDLNCPQCGTSIAANLPDTTLPAGWLSHQAVTCGKCGETLKFQDGGSTPADAITAWVFSLRGSSSGAVVGAAVVCLEARYLSLKLRGQPRIERRQPAQWRGVPDDLAAVQEGATVDRGSALGALLSGDVGQTVTVMALRRERIDVSPLATAQALDSVLLGIRGT